jgi:hypothetical protein
VRGLAALGLSTLGTRTRQKLCSKEGIVESLRRVSGTATQTLATELSLGFMGGHIVRCHDERIRKKLEQPQAYFGVDVVMVVPNVVCIYGV